MRIVLTGILFITFMLFRCPSWLASPNAPYILRALAYSFFHANIFHLAVNALSLCVLFTDRNRKDDARYITAAFIIAVIVYPLGFRPCVGFSNVLFALCGLRTRPLSCGYWWSQPTVITFIVVMVAMCFFPQFAGTNHLAAFVLGFIFINVRHSLEPLIRDAARYTGHR